MSSRHSKNKSNASKSSSSAGSTHSGASSISDSHASTSSSAPSKSSKTSSIISDVHSSKSSSYNTSAASSGNKSSGSLTTSGTTSKNSNATNYQSSSLVGNTLAGSYSGGSTSCWKSKTPASGYKKSLKSSSISSASSSSSSSKSSSYYSSKCSSSVPRRPKFCDKLKDILNCEPYIVINSKQDMENRGFVLQSFIVSDDVYQFFSAKKNGEMILCKLIQMDKCSPRYRENMTKYSLKIARYFGGRGGPPVSEYFVQIHEIFKLNSEIYMFMEECPSKSLYLILLDHDKFTAEDERKWTMQITKGIAKMHEYGIAHRFLKLQHILFDSGQNVKIAGWSKAVTFWDPYKNIPLLQNKERKSRKNCHLPPESFRHAYDASKVDMWSLGVLMVCMNTRCYPFDVRSKAKFSAQWRQFSYRHQMNRYVRAACNQAFWIDPKRRTQPNKFLDEPYFHASVKQITPKQVKTSIDPKYDRNMPAEKILQVSKFGFSSVSSNSAISSKSNSSKSSQVTSSFSGTTTGSSSHKSTPKVSSNASSSVSSSGQASDRNGEDNSQTGDEDGDDNASGVEGRQIGSEVPDEEILYESTSQEISAPEEQADQATPVPCSHQSSKTSTTSSTH